MPKIFRGDRESSPI
jgi:hypothetical protein